MAPDDMPVLVKNLASLMRALRRLHFPLGTRDLLLAVQALEITGAHNEAAMQAVLEAVWCKGVEDIAWFRLAFRQWAMLARRPGGAPVETYMASLARQRRTDGAATHPSWLAGDAGTTRGAADISLAHGASRREVLSHERLERLTDDELAWLMALYRPRTPLMMPSYLGKPGVDGHVWSPQHTVRYGREGSEWMRLYFERPRPEPLLLTVLLDMSGSMAVFQRPLLLFLHAMMRHQRGLAVYGFSTRLTRLTEALRRFHVDRALSEIAASVPDRGGGTRIADSLELLWRRERGRGISPRSTVVLVSDGFEAGDGTLTAQWAGRLAQFTGGRLYWWSPLTIENPRGLKTPSSAALARHSIYAAIPHFEALVQAWAKLDRQPAL